MAAICGCHQGGGDIGLALETLPVLVIRRHPGAQNLQRALTGKAGMLGEVDLAHTAGTQASDKGITGNVSPSCPNGMGEC